MEINLALLLMAGALAGLLSLFPVGMRQRNAATSDTTQAAFSTMLFHAMRGNAQHVTNWNDWLEMATNGVNFGVVSNSPSQPTVPSISIIPTSITATTPLPNLTGEISGYPIAGQTLRVKLSLTHDNNDPRIITAVLQSTTRQFTDVSKEPKYATSFFYLGM